MSQNDSTTESLAEAFLGIISSRNHYYHEILSEVDSVMRVVGDNKSKIESVVKSADLADPRGAAVLLDSLMDLITCPPTKEETNEEFVIRQTGRFRLPDVEAGLASKWHAIIIYAATDRFDQSIYTHFAQDTSSFKQFLLGISKVVHEQQKLAGRASACYMSIDLSNHTAQLHYNL